MFVDKIFKATVKNETGEVLYTGAIQFLISGNENQPAVNGLFSAKDFKPEFEMQPVILDIPQIHTGKIQLNRKNQNEDFTIYKIYFDFQDWFTNSKWLAKVLAE